MSSIGPGFHALPGGCGGGPAVPALPAFAHGPLPQAAAAFGGFEIPAFANAAAASPFGDERFVATQLGGVIVGADRAPVGRVPAGAFVDTKDGKLYGPDSKPIDVPEGAKVHFNDLPDLDELLSMARGGGFDGAGAPGVPQLITSHSGGVILGADGKVAGRIPEGSFVDPKSGKVYGPDTKPITVPEGGSVDFFDLPDLEELRAQTRGGGTAPGKLEPQTLVGGQWGPGGITDFKGGATKVGGAHGGCDMEHGGPPTTKAGGGGPFIHPAHPQLQGLMQQLHHAMAGIRPTGYPAGMGTALGGGLATAVGGASGLGTIPSLEASLRELVKTLDELAKALQATAGGGTVHQKTETAPAKTESEPAKTETTPATTTTTSPSSGSTTSDSSSSSETEATTTADTSTS